MLYDSTAHSDGWPSRGFSELCSVNEIYSNGLK